jgi:hypothetical protein
MATALTIYAKPSGTVVQLTLDSGQVLTATTTTASGRDDAHVLPLPDSTRGQGSVLTVMCDGHQPQTVRGILHPNDDDGPALFQFDDFGALAVTTVTPPTPEPPPTTGTDDPEAIIQAVYARDDHDLSTHDGCGQFTEACCDQLHTDASQWWGHIRKTAGQNQYNGHAVDALMLASGEGAGIYDIIHDSVSPTATPQYIYKGPPDLTLWYYDDPVTQLRIRVLPRGGA